MKRLWAIFAVAMALATPDTAQSLLPFAPSVAAAGNTGSVAFALPTGDNIHYISASGSDAANGLTPGTAWATPNHALNCGDVIIAATGAYSPTWAWGAVSSCPSTTGGIDGAGGIYAAVMLCGDASVGGCTTSTVMNVNTSHWAIEGFKSGGSGSIRSFICNASSSGTTLLGYVAFINDIAVNSAQGFGENEGGLNHNVPGNGCDEYAVVGSIAQNANQDGICLAAIDVVGPANLDSLSGTHVFIAGNYGIANGVNCSSDGECIMFDTWDAHGYTKQGVIENNICYASERFNYQLFYQAFNSSAPIIRMFNNTSFDGNVESHVTSASTNGDINFQSTTAAWPWVTAVYNNISKTNSAATPGGGAIYAQLVGGNYSNLTIGGSGIENDYKGSKVSCTGGGTCDAGFNVTVFNSGSSGTNIFTDPAFKSTADLISNHLGAPNCSGFQTTTACMGYNGVVTSLSVIDDLTPTAGGTTSKGYQLPGACVNSGDFFTYFPTWLKGIVYLHWDGSAITQKNTGMLTLPCGM